MYEFEIDGKRKYLSLYLGLRGEIARGKIKAGERLPSKRALAEELGVSVVTVQQAYEQLLAEGYIRSRERSGYFAENVPVQKGGAVAPDNRAQPPRRSYNIDFVKGSVPAELFPFSTWAKLLRATLSSCGEHLLERVGSCGDEGLRRAISAYLFRVRGIDADPQNIVIGGGAEHLYGVFVQLLGRDKVFGYESPGYSGAPDTYLLNGARVAPIKAIAPDICPSFDDFSKIDVLHLSPSHQFPTGYVMPAGVRVKLLEWAKGGGRYIVEDDYDSEFRLTGRPLQSMQSLCPERVIYMNTFSKSLAPSMRMGYAVLPPALGEEYRRLFSKSANIVPLFEQKALAEMIEGGYFERHISRLRNHFKALRRELSEKFGQCGEKCEVYDSGSGPHFVVRFYGASDGEIKERAERAGIRLRCLNDYCSTPREELDGCAVINYSGVSAERLKAFDAGALCK